MEDEKEEAERCEWEWQLQGRAILDHSAIYSDRERETHLTMKLLNETHIWDIWEIH